MADERDDAPARLDRRVAEAADAWLTDPRDTGVYARLVAAVTERRAALDAAARMLAAVRAADEPGPVGPDEDGTRPRAVHAAEQTDQVVTRAADRDEDDDADEEPEPAVPLRPVGADLLGDPRAVLDRLRRG